MLSVEKLVASARACLGWPYVSPGTNNAKGIDCSGLFVKCFRDQGATIYHGSNTIWRKYCVEKGELKSESQLEPGMAVFKHKKQDTAKYPDGQGDFCHIGMVTQVNPLEIVEASSVSGKVITNKKLGKWVFCGRLKGVAYGNMVKAPETPEAPTEGQTDTDAQPVALSATVCAENGKPVKLRKEHSQSCTMYDLIPVGTVVTVTLYKSDWCRITYRNRKGWWMMTRFLSFG